MQLTVRLVLNAVELTNNATRLNAVQLTTRLVLTQRKLTNNATRLERSAAD